MKTQGVHNHTRAFYERRAPEYAVIWGKADPILRPFARKLVGYLPPDPRRTIPILDAGTGTARDVKMLRRRGYDAYGLDFSSTSIALARQGNPSLRDRLFVADLRDLTAWQGRFRGVWDNATFHHIPSSESDVVIGQYKKVFVPNAPGILFLRQKAGNFEGLINTGEYKGKKGRYFKQWQEDELRALVERHDFRVLESGKKPDVRKIDFVWLFAQLG